MITNSGCRLIPTDRVRQIMTTESKSNEKRLAKPPVYRASVEQERTDSETRTRFLQRISVTTNGYYYLGCGGAHPIRKYLSAEELSTLDWMYQRCRGNDDLTRWELMDGAHWDYNTKDDLINDEEFRNLIKTKWKAMPLEEKEEYVAWLRLLHKVRVDRARLPVAVREQMTGELMMDIHSTDHEGIRRAMIQAQEIEDDDPSEINEWPLVLRPPPARSE